MRLSGHGGWRFQGLASPDACASSNIAPMDVVSAKVCGTIAIVLGMGFLGTSALRLTHPDLDVVLVALNSALGILALIAGVRLLRYAARKAKADGESAR